MRWRAAVALAFTLGAFAPDALAQQPAKAGTTVRPVEDARRTARTVIVVGGIMVSVGFVMSWTGIGGLVWEATQHETVRCAAPLSIASVPVEVVGSILVVAGAIELLRPPSTDLPMSEPAPPPDAVATRPLFSVPLVRADF